MKIENQVCSLESSKLLAELGLEVASYFVRLNTDGANTIMSAKDGWRGAPAYTVAELGQMLPDWIKLSSSYSFNCLNHYGEWITWYENEYGDHLGNGQSMREADARALLLIWLIKNKLVDVAVLNKRMEK